MNKRIATTTTTKERSITQQILGATQCGKRTRGVSGQVLEVTVASKWQAEAGTSRVHEIFKHNHGNASLHVVEIDHL